MRVESVDAVAIDIPLTRNFGGSTYSVLKRSTVITYLRTDAGLVSEVYNGDNREHGAEIVRLIREVLGPRLQGVDVLAIEKTWDDLFTLSHASRDRKTLMEAIACVDCALWDVIGKACGLTVAELLGGKLRPLPIISIGGYYMPGKTLSDIGSEMEAYQRAGMAGCKFKVGGLTPEADAERVEVARDAAGPDFVLAVDANRGWSVGDAVRFAQLVEPFDIRWFEEPCRWLNDRESMRDVRYMAGIPVAAGQSESARAGLRDLMAAGAIDVCNADASWIGGPTEWRRLAALAGLYEVEMGHHEEPQVAAHLLAAIPHGTYVETFDPERDPLFWNLIANRRPFAGGEYLVPGGPGLGLELDAEYIERYRA